MRTDAEREDKTATERLIKRALIELYQKKPISKIRISEITESCHVSRATFYFYFADIYDCLTRIEDDMLKGIDAYMNDIVVETVRHSEDRDDFLQPYIQMLQYIAGHHQCFQALLFGSESVRFRQKYVHNIEARFRLSLEMNGRTQKDRIPYLCALYSGAIVQLFSYWLQSGREKTPEQIADIAYQALFLGLMNPTF